MNHKLPACCVVSVFSIGEVVNSKLHQLYLQFTSTASQNTHMNECGTGPFVNEWVERVPDRHVSGVCVQERRSLCSGARSCSVLFTRLNRIMRIQYNHVSTLVCTTPSFRSHSDPGGVYCCAVPFFSFVHSVQMCRSPREGAFSNVLTATRSTGVITTAMYPVVLLLPKPRCSS